MNDRRKLPNGHTVKSARDWARACRWAAKYCKYMFNREWYHDKISDAYMAARNGYKAGYAAGHRAERNEGEKL